MAALAAAILLCLGATVAGCVYCICCPTSQAADEDDYSDDCEMESPRLVPSRRTAPMPSGLRNAASGNGRRGLARGAARAVGPRRGGYTHVTAL